MCGGDQTRAGREGQRRGSGGPLLSTVFRQEVDMWVGVSKFGQRGRTRSRWSRASLVKTKDHDATDVTARTKAVFSIDVAYNNVTVLMQLNMIAGFTSTRR